MQSYQSNRIFPTIARRYRVQGCENGSVIDVRFPFSFLFHRAIERMRAASRKVAATGGANDGDGDGSGDAKTAASGDEWAVLARLVNTSPIGFALDYMTPRTLELYASDLVLIDHIAPPTADARNDDGEHEAAARQNASQRYTRLCMVFMRRHAMDKTGEPRPQCLSHVAHVHLAFAETRDLLRRSLKVLELVPPEARDAVVYSLVLGDENESDGLLRLVHQVVGGVLQYLTPAVALVSMQQLTQALETIHRDTGGFSKMSQAQIMGALKRHTRVDFVWRKAEVEACVRGLLEGTPGDKLTSQQRTMQQFATVMCLARRDVETLLTWAKQEAGFRNQATPAPPSRSALPLGRPASQESSEAEQNAHTAERTAVLWAARLGLVSKLRSADAGLFADRGWYFRNYRDCAVGSELVAWMLEHLLCSTRQQAVERLQGLLTAGLLKHVKGRGVYPRTDSAVFEDEYRFFELDDEQVELRRSEADAAEGHTALEQQKGEATLGAVERLAHENTRQWTRLQIVLDLVRDVLLPLDLDPGVVSSLWDLLAREKNFNSLTTLQAVVALTAGIVATCTDTEAAERQRFVFLEAYMTRHCFERRPRLTLLQFLLKVVGIDCLASTSAWRKDVHGFFQSDGSVSISPAVRSELMRLVTQQAQGMLAGRPAPPAFSGPCPVTHAVAGALGVLMRELGHQDHTLSLVTMHTMEDRYLTRLAAVERGAARMLNDELCRMAASAAQTFSPAGGEPEAEAGGMTRQAGHSPIAWLNAMAQTRIVLDRVARCIVTYTNAVSHLTHKTMKDAGGG